ncbi:MAG TPA: extracellular solute-binding protein [Chloroflexota bacterium]|nr:extracellular solute-binding protein [Chloroflexota bacterium]
MTGRTRRWALAAGGGLMVQAACAAPGGARPASEAAQPSAEPATIRWTDDNSQPSLAFAEEFGKRFSAKYPHITATMEVFAGGSWKERSEKYTTMAVSGTMPEVVWFSATFLRPFLMKGTVRELDQFIKRDWKQGDVEDFYKGPFEGMKIDGKQMAIPVTINNNLMYVNLNHLQEAGLAYPGDSWSREQFMEYVQKLHRRGGERWGFDMHFDNLDRNVTWIMMNGGEAHDPSDGPQVTKLTYDLPKTIEGLQFLHDMRWRHQVSAITNDERGGAGQEDAFLQGKIAIYMVASNNAANIFTKAPDTGLEWDFLTLPRGPGGQGARVSMDGYVIDRQTKFGEQAWLVMRELTSVEMAEPRASIRRLTPPRRSGHVHWERGYQGKNAKIGRPLAEAARADPRSFWLDSDIVGGIMEKYMQATFNRNELGVPEAMRQAMAEVRGYYASR